MRSALAMRVLAVAALISAHVVGAQRQLATPLDCDFETDLCNFVSDAGSYADASSWRRRAGRTPTTDSGPNVDHTLESSSGTFVYAEQKGNYGNEFYLSLDVGEPFPDEYNKISFWYHMFGRHTSYLKFQSSTDGSTWSDLFSKTGEQTTSPTEWMYADVPVTNKAQFFRFAQMGTGNKADSAIDDFRAFYTSPTPLPSASPSPLPSASPSSLPSPVPTAVPYSYEFAPSVHPTSKPTTSVVYSYTFSPSVHPTSQPTGALTTVEVSFEFAATAAPSAGEEASVKTEVASALSVSEDDIRNFAIEVVTTVAQSGGGLRRRRLLNAYTWQVSFDLVVVLGDLGFPTQGDLVDGITTALSPGGPFEAAVVSAVPVLASVSVLVFVRLEATWCSIDLEGSSAGFADGNAASLVVKVGGVDTAYDDSWMARGFNVVAFAADNSVLVSGQFDTFALASQSGMMLSFLQALPDGTLVTVLAQDSAEDWSGASHISADLTAYMASAFGASLFSSVGFRASYGLVGYKGAAAPLDEAYSATTTGPVQVEAFLRDCGTPAPSLHPSSEPTARPSPQPTTKTQAPTLLPSSPFPTPQRTQEPTPVHGNWCKLGINGHSAGFLDGNEASLSVTEAFVSTGFDDSWMGRGFNVVTFAEDGSVLSTSNYDVYSSSAQSDSMLAFLQALPDFTLTVMVAQDALDYWDPSMSRLGDDLKDYMASSFGAAMFGSLGFRDSYGLISYKGSSTPFDEVASAAGTGSATVTTYLDNCVTPAPSVTPAPTPSPVPVPSSMPNIAPSLSPTQDHPNWCQLGLQASSAGFADGNDASLAVTEAFVDTGFDDSWMGRGFNVVTFAEDGSVLSTSNYDVYSSSAQSDSMLAFLQALPDFTLTVMVAQDALDYWDPSMSRLGDDLKDYMASSFGAAMFGSLGFRDSYGLISYKGALSPIDEAASAAGTGSVSVNTFLDDCATPSPSFSHQPIPLPSTPPTSLATLPPSLSPTVDRPNWCKLGLNGLSAGFVDGNDASLAVSDASVVRSFDDSWMGRGFNVVTFAEDGSVLSSMNFDTYSSSAQSDSMLAFLQALPDFTLTVMVAQDALDYWDPSMSRLGDDLKDYMASSFGAAMFGSLGFRDSYGLISYKGALSPIDEAASAAGTGSVTVNTFLDDCATIAPTLSLLPSPSPTVPPSQLPSSTPSPLPTSVPSTHIPTPEPTFMPSRPTPTPTHIPTPVPTSMPSRPTLTPTPLPTTQPTTPPPTMLPSTSHPTAKPSLTPIPSPSSLPSAHPTPLPSASPSMSPTMSPTMLPTEGECNLELEASSEGFYDTSPPGGSASLVVRVSGVDTAYDDSWMGRGFNVVAFQSDASVLSSAQFDVPASAAQSTSMLAFLEGVPSGSVVAVVVKDSPDTWPNQPYLGADLVAYMGSAFGAALFSSMDFRGGYALVGEKGAASPYTEVSTAPAAGPATSTADVVC